MGNFRQTFANSENPDETALNEPSHQDFHCLLSSFIFFIPTIKNMKETRSLSDFSRLSEFTRLYPNVKKTHELAHSFSLITFLALCQLEPKYSDSIFKHVRTI